MHILHGIYYILPRRLAFRNDFCLGCAAPRRTVQISTLNVLHLYGIPVLPLARWKRWSCTECGRRPDENLKTRRPFKIAGLLILLMFTFVFWVMPVDSKVPTMSWVYRFGAPIGAFFTAIHLATSRPDEPGYKELRSKIPMANDTICPFCDVPLVNAFSDCYCPFCQMRRL